MPYDPNEDDEIIIKHGNLREWLAYKVGPHDLKGWWIVMSVALVSALLARVA